MTKRRTRGDGGLYQRHDHQSCPALDENGHRPEHKCQGRWVANVEVMVDGKRRRKSIYARTSTEARRKLTQALREREQGTLVVASMTTGAWLTYWLDNIADVRPQTMRSYRSKVNIYLVPNIGKIRLTELRPEHIRGMYKRMRMDGLAEATLRQTHAILRRSLKVAVQEGKLGVSPAERMEAPSTVVNKREQLTVEQARTVLAAAGESARWWLGLFYGMRQGEALGLRWCDVDFDQLIIHVEQSLQTDVDGQLIFGPPKSRTSRRPLPMLPQIEARLRVAHYDAGSPKPDSDKLIFAREGVPIRPRDDWQAWRNLLNLASSPPLAPIPAVSLHAARNSAASLMEAAGVPDRLVAQILGHAQVQITHGYQKADLARMREAMHQAAQLLEIE